MFYRTHTHVYEDLDNPDVAPSLKYGERRASSLSVPSLNSMEAAPGATPAAEREEEAPKISLIATAVLLGAVTALVAVTSEFLVSSIDGLSTKSGACSHWGISLLLC
jgi:Ca2+/H+ antiporter